MTTESELKAFVADTASSLMRELNLSEVNLMISATDYRQPLSKGRCQFTLFEGSTCWDGATIDELRAKVAASRSSAAKLAQAAELEKRAADLRQEAASIVPVEVIAELEGKT